MYIKLKLPSLLRSGISLRTKQARFIVGREIPTLSVFILFGILMLDITHVDIILEYKQFIELKNLGVLRSGRHIRFGRRFLEP